MMSRLKIRIASFGLLVMAATSKGLIWRATNGEGLEARHGVWLAGGR